MEAPAPVSAIEDGNISASAAARAVFEAGAAVDGAEFALTSESESETDEGTYCQSSSHALSFRGETVWRFGTSYTANIGGARGTSSSCSVEGNQLVVELSRAAARESSLGRSLGRGRKGEERRRYPLGDLLVRAAVLAGAPEPQPGSTIPVQPASYRVLRKAAIRSGIEPADSSIAGSYHPGDVIMAQEHGTNRAGVARLRTGRGWISNKPDIVERTALPTAAKLLAFSKILHQRLAPPDALVDRDVIGEVARQFRLADAAQLVDEAELAELAQRRERNRGHTASSHALVEVDVDDAA